MKLTSIVFICLISTLFFNGCSNKKVVNHNYIYVGESKNWSAEYQVTGKGVFTEDTNHKTSYENQSQSKFTLTYKGSLAELASIKHFEYGFQSSSRGTKQSQDSPPKEKVLILKNAPGNGAIEIKDEIIKATVVVDDITETIELKSK
ncbi:hypothetical protein QFZ77_007586 [Paenibacillus sp. V4I3]|uniref:hypothetical protein n=1 Tax=unclassified Paenibacillus TaxID=185978 RepID=UPI0027817208|nr:MULTISPECIES: hypothetical protein [unclassified Paenibacillus]MDQ0878927.1 hypothetical protein [Paenibacillus sp. V4I3]MDQ0885347.1 hypothetical protein [Paenibacillus sp. V4I9]